MVQNELKFLIMEDKLFILYLLHLQLMLKKEEVTMKEVIIKN
jgi:hypothetical protein